MTAERDLKITATAETDQAKTQIDQLDSSVKGVASSTQWFGEEGQRAGEGAEVLGGKTKGAAVEARLFAVASRSAAAGLTAFRRAMTALLGPVGVLIGVLVAILTNLKELGAWFGRVGETMDAWVNGVGKGTRVLDENGKVVDALDPKYRKLAAAQDLHTRALELARRGIIATTENMETLDAQAAVHEANFRKATVSTDELAAAFKKMGINIPETFDSLKTKGNEFIARYKIILEKEGPAAARIFAQENESLLDGVESRYVKLGKDVPPELKKISEGIGLIPKAIADLAESEATFQKLTEAIDDLAKKHDDLTKSLATNAKAFQDHTAKVEADRKSQIDGAAAVTKATIASLQEQVKETVAAHAARTISDEEYRTKINQLFADQAKAKQDGYEAEKKIDENAKVDLADMTAKYKEQTTSVKEAIDDVNKKQEEATEKLKALNVERNEEVRAMQAAVPLWGTSLEFAKLLAGIQTTLAAETKASAVATNDLGTQFGASAAQVPALSSGVDSLTAKVNALAAAARAAAAALDSVTGGGGSSAGGA